MSGIGYRVKQAREFRGLTQTELAHYVGIKQPAIAQIEAGFTTPRDEHLAKISMKTGFPLSFFRRPARGHFPLPSHLHLRARKAFTAQGKKTAYRHAELAFEAVASVLRRVKLPPVRLPEGCSDPISAAESVRSAFGLSPGAPIPSVLKVAEKAGVLVFEMPMPEKCDGFSCWVEADTRRPVVFLSADVPEGRIPGDRQNFTLAHELGHLSLHEAASDSDSLEDEANHFAGEFLMPECSFLDELPDTLTLSTAGELKQRWFVVIQAIVRRAYRLGTINAREYKWLNIQVARKGWKKREPYPIDPDHPKAIAQIVRVAYAGETNPLAKMASDVNLTRSRLGALLGLAPLDTIPGGEIRSLSR